MAKKKQDPATGKEGQGKENDKTRALSEFHVDPKGRKMTTDHGVPIVHTDDSLKAGPRGPTLLQDFHLREKIMRFDHERIPERAVHARGAAAHGVFEATEDISKICRADFLKKGTKTPVFVRFSTVGGSRGSADTVRDVRGFATKFYTKEGNFDLVGNNIPVFFIQDGIKFPDLVHSVKPEPHNEIPQASSAHDTFYDFCGLTPESTHMLMWLLSDRAIPRSYGTMEGFGVHTFRMINDQGKSKFVKFHWKPVGGVHSLVWDEAQKLIGKDPDFHRRGLWDQIEDGQFPEWELGIQVVDDKDEMKFDFDLLDSTKIIPEELVPVKIIGKLTLNRNPDNYFAETEQVAFCTNNLVSGIDATNDPLMQARMFSYLDTQLTRLGGPNFAEIPINRPLNKAINHQQDGFHRTGILKSRVNYFPNSLAGGDPQMATVKEGGFIDYPEQVDGKKTRDRSETFDDHYTQATLFYRSLSKVEQEHLIDAGIFELSKCQFPHVRERIINNFMNVDQAMAQAIAAKVGVKATRAKGEPAKPKLSPALSQLSHPGRGLKGRMVAVLVADGFSSKDYEKLNSALKSEGAKACLVSSMMGPIKSAEGTSYDADKTFTNSGSVNFDAIFVPGGKASNKTLSQTADVVLFINEAFKHHKTIAYTADAKEILDQTDLAKSKSQEGVLSSTEARPFVEAMKKHKHWNRDVKLIPA